jgi:micrococcal nuclease
VENRTVSLAVEDVGDPSVEEPNRRAERRNCHTHPMSARRRRRTPASLVVALLALTGVLGYQVITQFGQEPGADLSAEPGQQPAVLPATETTGIPPQATEATIDYVHDGDTLFLADGRKVRLLGINTPEIGDNLECYGNEATALLRSLLPKGTHVWVNADIEPLDQYGRSLLFIYTDDATNINLELLKQGAAEVMIYAPNLLLQQSIEGAESAARAAGVGLWGACS